jgi:hypothetical protein
MTMKPSHPVKAKILPVRLDPETQEILNKLQAKTGLKGAALIRLCIRRMADRLDRSDNNHSDTI